MTEKTLEDVSGTITDKEIKEDKTGKQYFKFKIDDQTCSWFTANDKNAYTTASNLHKGDNVKGIIEITEKEYNGSNVNFKNIKEIHKVEITEEKVKNEQESALDVVKEEDKKSILLKKPQQVKVITANSEKDFEEMINKFCKEHKVFATQTSFQMLEGLQKFMAVLYYDE